MQLTFHEALVPQHRGAGRPRSEARELARQHSARVQAKRAAKALLPEGALKEEYRRKRKKWDAARYKRDPEKVKASVRRSYRKHFEKRAATDAERYRRFARQGMLYRAEKRAAEKGWDFNLTIDDIVIPGHCPVLGIPIQIGKRATGGTLDSAPSLDRIDNTKGYVSGNVCVISYRANAIKRDASLAELEAIVGYLRRSQP